MELQLDSSTIKMAWTSRKFLVFAVALVLLEIVLIGTLLVPQVQEAYASYQKMQAEKPKLQKLLDKLDELESIEMNPDFAQVDVVEKALPSRKPLMELLLALSSVSQDTGIAIEQFELRPGLVATDSTQPTQQASSKGAFDQLALDVMIRGTFDDIVAFLLKVEEVSPFSTITSMEIGNQINMNAEGFEDLAQEAVFQAVLTTETYFFTQSIAARIDSPLPKLSEKERQVLSALASFVPTEAPVETEIRGGGSEDLFNLQGATESAISF
jgi:Tfp pilus assembly protein PilO